MGGAMLLTGLVALLAPGCQRRTNVGLIPPDSTKTAAEDSSLVRLGEVTRLWEGGGDRATAAGVTAQVLAEALQPLQPPEWRERASYLLDSLGVGAEFAESNCAMVVNQFSRSDPDAGSWPFLYWCAPGGVAYQGIEGKNLRLQSLVTRGVSAAGLPPDSVRLAAAVFSRRTPSGLQPLVMTWSMPIKGTRWSLVETLGPDSLGGYGTAAFEAVSDTGAQLSTRTYRPPAGFLECATCPHAFVMSRFRWTPQGFVRIESRRVASPYATFTDFIRALVASDRVAASEHVSDPDLVFQAQSLDWHLAKGAWRPAPGSDETPLEMRFFRGQKEAYVVRFRSQGDDWVITGFAPADRRVE